MGNYAAAIRRATLEASRLHDELGIEESTVRGSGRIDVYNAMSALGLPLLFTKLDGLLGVYLRQPSPGVLITTQRPQSQQRFTAAHELGHFRLEHTPSLDDDSILRRAPFYARTGDNVQEVEAEAFAAAFLLPQWLVEWHCRRQHWTDADLMDPANIYQLALRAGTSFEATVWTLNRYDVFNRTTAVSFAGRELKKIKQQLLGGYEPENYRSDVWLVTNRDDEMQVNGNPSDLVVIRLPEHSGSGYVWSVEPDDGSALTVVADGREEIDNDGIGAQTLRRIIAAARNRYSGEWRFAETRPWQPKKPITIFSLQYNLLGPEPQGWYKDQRHQHLEGLRAA